MPIIEYERIIRRRGGIAQGVEKLVLLDAPDSDTMIETGHGKIEVGAVKRNKITGRITSMSISGDVLKGTPLKRRHKRTTEKRVSIGPGGSGAQTLSDQERIVVRTWESMNIDDRNYQIDLSLGVSQVVTVNAYIGRDPMKALEEADRARVRRVTSTICWNGTPR